MIANVENVKNPAYRAFYECPAWCVRSDHAADVVDEDNPPCHYGPEFGQVGVQLHNGKFEAAVYLDGEASFVSDPAELRRVAADMVRSAEWIEARR